jgi:MOSC domain-containing protein YiiM
MPGDGRPTGIFKTAVNGPVQIGPEGLIGDVQADRRVHGGPEKAIHQFPVGNLQKLALRFPEIAQQFVPGCMGENISTPEWDESDVCIGDVFRLGTARVQLNQPRTPCWKIDARHGIEGITRYVAENGIAGWYYRVLDNGVVAAGDVLELIERHDDAISLREFSNLILDHRPPLDALARLISTPGLNPNWRGKLQARWEWLRAHHQNGD